MLFTYQPADGPAERWTYKPQKLRVSEAEALEKRTGWDFQEFQEHLLQGSVRARRALLWMYRRRVHHTIRFEDVDFAMDEVTLEMDREELLELREKIATSPFESSTARDRAMAMVDEQIESAEEPEGKADASSAG